MLSRRKRFAGPGCEVSNPHSGSGASIDRSTGHEERERGPLGDTRKSDASFHGTSKGNPTGGFGGLPPNGHVLCKPSDIPRRQPRAQNVEANLAATQNHKKCK